MAGTQVNMSRSTVTIEGTNKYEISASCTVKGTLADTKIFLLTIVTTDDPKDDTLARVIQIADIEEYGTDRDDAIAEGIPYFRSSSVLLRYDVLDTANAAWKELSSRINSLVEQYDVYLSDFETFAGGEVISYPTVDPSVKNQLIADYQATLQPIEDAEEERNTKQSECNVLSLEFANVNERLVEAQSDLASYTNIQSILNASIAILAGVEPAIGADRTAIRNQNSLSGASAPEKATIEASLVSMDAQLVTFGTTNTTLSNLSTGQVATVVNTLQVRVSDLTAERNQIQSDLNLCQFEVAELQATVDRARAARDEALAAVRAVCSTYSP